MILTWGKSLSQSGSRRLRCFLTWISSILALGLNSSSRIVWNSYRPLSFVPLARMQHPCNTWPSLIYVANTVSSIHLTHRSPSHRILSCHWWLCTSHRDTGVMYSEGPSSIQVVKAWRLSKAHPLDGGTSRRSRSVEVYKTLSKSGKRLTFLGMTDNPLHI